jgi:hypothetical protein
MKKENGPTTKEIQYRKALERIATVKEWYMGPRVSQGTECVKIALTVLREIKV